MQDKLSRYKQLSAMADEDQTDGEVEEQVNLYYELFHPEEARAWAVYQTEEAIEPVKHCEWPDTGRDKDRHFGDTANPIQWNWW